VRPRDIRLALRFEIEKTQSIYGTVSSEVSDTEACVLIGNMDGRARLELMGRVGVQGVLLSWGLAGSTVFVESSQEVYSIVN
jgi:hypothetical protein